MISETFDDASFCPIKVNEIKYKFICMKEDIYNCI